MPVRPTTHAKSPWGRSWAEWEQPKPAAQRSVPWRLRRALLRWPVLFAVVLLLAAGLATDLVRPASSKGRLSDLRAYYVTMQTGISSCSGGLRDTLTALTAILDGSSTQRGTAESIAINGVEACSPVSNGDLFDMATTQPPRSLNGYGLAGATSALYQWAYPDASLAQSEIYRLLAGRQPPGSPAAQQVYRQIQLLDRLGRQIEASFYAAATRLNGSLGPLTPTIVPAPPAILLGR
jgi:hypothetical protein